MRKALGVLGRKLLVVGEVGSGKTRLTAEILEGLIDAGYGECVTVVDMAPPRMPGGIGGRLSECVAQLDRIRYLAPPVVYPPRMAARSPEELLWMARRNAEAIEALLNAYLEDPSEILVMNDLSLYLHAGDVGVLLECIRVCRTLVANAYYGRRLAEDLGTGISARERRLVELLVGEVDLVLHL